MQQIIDVINKIKLPDPIFRMVKAEDDGISFEPDTSVADLEGDDIITKLVNESYKNYLTFAKDSDGKFKYKIEHTRVVDRVYSYAREFHIQLWMAVNNKKQWNRTKLKKSICYANSDKFKEKAFELFLDAVKYGIKKNSLSKIDPIHKFIAAKFEAMVEAECPR